MARPPKNGPRPVYLYDFQPSPGHHIIVRAYNKAQIRKRYHKSTWYMVHFCSRYEGPRKPDVDLVEEIA